MSRTIFTRGTVLAAATMLALSACGSADKAPAEEERDAGGTTATEDEAPQEEADENTDTDTDASDSGDTEDSSDDTTKDAEEADGEGSDTSASEAAAVEIGTEFTDEETGDVITVVSATRHNPTEYYMASDNPEGEMIYLEVAVTPGDTYGGVLSERDFYLEDGGDEVNYAASADDELIDAGFEYFDGAPRREGEAAGYIPVYLESTGDTIQGAYVRPEMKILGEDTTVPEFRAEFEIPAA